MGWTDRTAHVQGQVRGLALAGAIHAGNGGRPAAGQDPSVAHSIPGSLARSTDGSWDKKRRVVAKVRPQPPDWLVGRVFDRQIGSTKRGIAMQTAGSGPGSHSNPYLLRYR